MKKIVTLLFLFMVIQNTYAQLTFQKTYGSNFNLERWYGVKTNDGGYAMAGATSDYGAGGLDVYLVKTNDSGSILWTKTYGGPNSDVAQGIKQTSDGGFIIAGATNSFGSGGFDLYLIRTDKNGDTLWTRTYGESTYDDDAWEVEQTDDGGFIVAGQWGSSGENFLVKTDSLGDTLWTKAYDSGIAFGLAQTDHHGFIFCGAGYVYPYADLMFLEKTDSLGNVKWYKAFGSPNGAYGYQVLNANDGGFICVGFISGIGAGGSDIFVVKTDTVGKLQWSKVIGTANADEADDIVSTGNGYTILCGTSPNSTNWQGQLVNIDNTGNINWVKDYTSNYSGSLIKTDDGGYAFTGDWPDRYLVKTDNNGNSGCSDSSATLIVTNYAVIVDSLVPNLLPGTIVGSTKTSIDSGGTATTLCISAGINQIKNNKISFAIYPNPCSECELKGVDDAADLTVTDILGRKVSADFTKTPDGYTMNLSKSGSGIYFVSDIKTGEVAKVVKQ